jgi:glutamate 5-kinase
VAIEELKFGDNDELSSKVAQLLQVDLLVLLTDIEGLFTENPKLNAKAKQIFEVRKWTQDILKMGTGPIGTRSLGGMSTKLKAAKLATEQGIETVIANGRSEKVLLKILKKEKIGTRFYSQKKEA